jgi:hypothetical protein
MQIHYAYYYKQIHILLYLNKILISEIFYTDFAWLLFQ